jgi:hypothetical protein
MVTGTTADTEEPSVDPIPVDPTSMDPISVDPMPFVPAECTLPTAERPARLGEFDQLVAGALEAPARLGPTHLRLVLDAGREDATRDLLARESACCSFFDFGLRRSAAGHLVLDVRVPERQAGVLDALAELGRPGT